MSLGGSFLIAMPQLRDPNFAKAVVFMLDHDDDGSLGLIINRETNVRATDLCRSVEIVWHGEDAPVGFGGPVEPQAGWLLVPADGIDLPATTEAGHGIRISRSIDALKAVAAAPPPRLRLLLGYAGWGPGQLVAEMAQGSWIVGPARADLVFDVPPAELWERALAELGVDPMNLQRGTGLN